MMPPPPLAAIEAQLEAIRQNLRRLLISPQYDPTGDPLDGEFAKQNEELRESAVKLRKLIPQINQAALRLSWSSGRVKDLPRENRAWSRQRNRTERETVQYLQYLISQIRLLINDVGEKLEGVPSYENVVYKLAEQLHEDVEAGIEAAVSKDHSPIHPAVYHYPQELLPLILLSIVAILLDKNFNPRRRR